jgi:predicted RNA-binding Zn-ribbon protein involved in translation (DUF1610 family)
MIGSLTCDSLPGPPIVGLWGMFERDRGNPSTPSPYCRITPSRLGTILLPFTCPNCSSSIDYSSERMREAHHDTRSGHGNYWCPTCGWRFYLNAKGIPYEGKVSETVAPSIVECITSDENGLTQVTQTKYDATRDDLMGTIAMAIS